MDTIEYYKLASNFTSLDNNQKIKLLEEKPDYFKDLPDYHFSGIICALDSNIKEYFYENYKDRILLLSNEDIEEIIRWLKEGEIELFDKHFENILKRFFKADFQNILYRNAYYHEISNYAEYIVSQDWYQEKITANDEDYFAFNLAYNLEKSLNSNDNKDISKFEEGIIRLLGSENDDEKVVQMIMKNYLHIIKDNQLSFYEFKKKIYKLIGIYKKEELDITNNMIMAIYLCEREEKQVTKANYFEFYYDSKDGLAGSAKGDLIRFNLYELQSELDHYKKYNIMKIIGTIGHELDHINHEQNIENNNVNQFTQLNLFNSSISTVAKIFDGKKFYHAHHDNYCHEYYAMIEEIKTFYDKVPLLETITDQDLKFYNKWKAIKLYKSFAFLEENQSNSYMTPVEFTYNRYNKYKDDLPKIVKYKLYMGYEELPDYLKKYQENLTQMEKFELGYDNEYIDILYKIATGELESLNLFEDIPRLYEEQKQIDNNGFGM